jgi:putative endonuclease
MNYSVYVLQSLKNGRRYVGKTSKSPKERLSEHNNRSNQYTKNNTPYKLIYYETTYCKKCAGKREIFLKSGVGRKFLDLISDSVSP